MRKTLLFVGVAMLVMFATSAWAGTLPSNRHIFVRMANGAINGYLDDAVYGVDDGTYNGSYYIKADGGGLNSMHITNTTANVYGQNTTMNTTDGTASGTFYISDTGGRGYNDSIILMVSVKPDGNGNLPANLSVNVKSSGYAFPLSTPASATHDTDVIDVTYGPSDFTSTGYGLHAYKPGPGTIDTWTLPLYGGQSDFTNGEQLLFIDLNLGNIYNSSLTDKGTVKVDFTISGLTTAADFNAYAWCYESNQGQGISWTQNTVGTSGTSSYRISYTGQ
ncbi:MAG: hypothetical protein PHD01_11895 [Geobacteraceae bacterium]|nr:hypothetical protein [Geobacteraceae bacterium]